MVEEFRLGYSSIVLKRGVSLRVSAGEDLQAFHESTLHVNELAFIFSSIVTIYWKSILLLYVLDPYLCILYLRSIVYPPSITAVLKAEISRVWYFTLYCFLLLLLDTLYSRALVLTAAEFKG